MRNPKTPFLATLLASLVLATPASAQTAQNTVGIAAAIVKDVRIKPAALKAFALAKLRQRIALADRVQTGALSRLQISLLDKTTVTVGANSLMTIDKFVYDPNGGSVSLTATKGALRFMSGSSKSVKTVNTPSATIGVRGTIFDTAVGELAVDIARRERAVPPGTQHDPATATLAVLRGPGPKRQGKAIQGAIDITAADRTVSLETPLMAAYVPYAGAAPIGPFSLSTPSLIQLNEFILPPGPKGPAAPPSGGQPVPSQFRNNSPAPPPPGPGWEQGPGEPQEHVPSGGGVDSGCG